MNHDTKEGWIMVSISSMACVFGASIVFIDKLLYKQHGSILSNTSLASLLPESQRRLNSTSLAYFWFFCGTIITFLLTRIIHWCTPDAIHACGSDSPIQHDHHHHHHQHSNDISNHIINNTLSPSSSPSSSSTSLTSSASKSENHHHIDNNNDNNTSLITSQNYVNKSKSNRHDEPNENQGLIHHHQQPSSYGTTLPDAHFRFHEHTHHTISHDHEERHIHHNDHQKDDHFHHDQKHQFLSIGIQTAIAICVHKFPEGLIMFISSQASSSLSVNVAAAMSIHNVTEGFMLVLPLYYATGSRVGSFFYAAIMGGLSQPLGALIGLLAFTSVDKDQVDALFGITFGIISGMMTFITIQSMLPQAIKFDDNHNRVVLFFFIGIFLIAFSSALKSL
ncbi:unnamed protein product [Cunninghamella blakesleeana]